MWHVYTDLELKPNSFLLANRGNPIAGFNPKVTFSKITTPTFIPDPAHNKRCNTLLHRDGVASLI